jgi:CubicO group peptidase (beta-lactamase class C family)
VTEYWPEFGQAGKADVPVRWLMGHRAGLPT